MRKKYIFSLLFSIAFVWLATAQDPIFSQFYAAPIQINPALTGNSIAPRITLNHRSQWPGISTAGVAYSTYAAAYDQFIERANSGIGVFVLTDNAGAGILKNTKVSGLYSYRVRLSKEWYTKIGVEASFVQTSLDWNRLIFSDQLDPESGPITPGGSIIPTEENQPEDLSPSYFDVSAGLVFYSSRYYAGLSLKHLNRPEDSFLGNTNNLGEGVPMRLVVHGGAHIDLGSSSYNRLPVFISPNILFANQGAFSQLNAGAYVGFGNLFGGAWFRHTFNNADAVIGLVGVRVKEFKIGYSFDMTVSSLGLANTGGSHEVSLSIEFNKNRKVDYNDCFQLFR